MRRKVHLRMTGIWGSITKIILYFCNMFPFIESTWHLCNVSHEGKKIPCGGQGSFIDIPYGILNTYPRLGKINIDRTSKLDPALPFQGSCICKNHSNVLDTCTPSAPYYIQSASESKNHSDLITTRSFILHLFAENLKQCNINDC